MLRLVMAISVRQLRGELSCWGNNWAGQADVPQDLGPVVAVSAGYAQTCTLASNGKVRCWGDNSDGKAFFRLGARRLPDDRLWDDLCH